MIFDFEHRLGGLGLQTGRCLGALMLRGVAARGVLPLSPGARCFSVGVRGDDDGPRPVRAALGAEPRIETSLVIDRSRPTTRKVRFVAGGGGSSEHMRAA